jgi:hypothetical protein
MSMDATTNYWGRTMVASFTSTLRALTCSRRRQLSKDSHAKHWV